MNKKLTIAITFLLAVLPQVNAQTSASSQEASFDTNYAENVIVRASNGYNNTIVYYKTPLNNQHHLVYNKPNDQSEFDWSINNALSGYNYIINDMVVIENICYFCGECNSNGLVGRIDLTNATNPTNPTIDFKFCTISEVKEFKRMDGIQASSTRDCLALIGDFGGSWASSGATFISWDVATAQWDYKTYKLNDNTEIFTDIAFTANGNNVVAVSRLIGSQYEFCLRCETTFWAFLMYPGTLANFNNRNRINTYNLTLQSSSNLHPTWHRDDVDIRLVANLSEDEDITVAYECYDTTKVCETQQQVAMFKVDLYNNSTPINVTVVEKQMVMGYFSQPGTLVDVKYLNYDNTIGLLHSCSGCSEEMSTLIQFPSWNGYGNIDALQIDSRVFSSMDIYNGGRVDIAGIDPLDNHLLYFMQQKSGLANSCYLTRPLSHSEELLGDPIPSEETTDDTIDNSFQPRNTYSSSSHRIKSKTKCITKL